MIFNRKFLGVRRMSPAYSSRVETFVDPLYSDERKKDAKKRRKKDANKKQTRKKIEKKTSGLQSKLIPTVLLYDLIPHVLF